MPTLNEARTAVYSRVESDFTELSESRITFDNEDFKEPEPADPWLRVAVRTTGREQDTLGRIGNRRFRSTAIVFAQVFVPSTKGLKRSDEIVRAFSLVFDAVSFSGLDFLAARSYETGPDGRWFIQVVECPFEYDEIR